MMFLRRLRCTILGFILYCNFGVSFACIMLLNGWQPIPISERAKSASIVVKGTIVRTFKSARVSLDKSYQAEVEFVSVLKGKRLLEDIADSKRGQRVYNVSNFGDKTECYADVKQGQDYLLFLTIFEGRLSGKYDDLFGAATEYRQDLEDEILTSLGWKAWSIWSECSVTCGGGIQTRRRDCIPDNQSDCEGGESEQRKCNSFLCKGVTNLLSFLQHVDLIPGVEKSEEWSSAYIFDGTANIDIPTTRFFNQNHFPYEFSILVTAKPNEDNRGYILTLSDIMGFVKLGVQVGLDPLFEYGNLSRSHRGQKPMKFKTDLSDGSWHQFAYGVTGSEVMLYVDCKLVDSADLDKSLDYKIATNSVISIGKSFFESRKYPRYEGYIEQLLISTDPTAAESQCDSNSGPITDLPHNTDNIPTAKPEETSTLGQKEVSISWTAWSPCSTSCGRGTQTRTAYCAGNDVTLDQCYSLSQGALQHKPCNPGKCPKDRKKCRHQCFNGGSCSRSSRCTCAKGYYGRHCQYATCQPGCYNGGYCQQPDTCSCPPGWKGYQCEQAVCEPPCINGGRCVRPGVCSCPYGFMPPDCKPHCQVQCYNGGTCTGFNVCHCPPGYEGNLCQTASCNPPCGRGGSCVAPDICMCSAGWTGPQCDRAICRPTCQNGGSCLYPYFCSCPASTYGYFCEKFVCTPPCLHGGTCIGLNTCACNRGHTGRYCEQRTCRNPCLNGGRCHNNTCRCKMGYYGTRCERRKCRYESVIVPVHQSYLQSYQTTYSHQCGLFGWNTCTSTKTTYRISHRTMNQVVNKCV